MNQIIHVYYRGEHIETREFSEAFFIRRDGERISWSVDDEKVYGSVQVWISNNSFATIINSVLVRWKVIIDGIVLEERGYASLFVSGKTVEFANADYRFVGRFSGQSFGSVDDIVSGRILERLLIEHTKKAKETEQE
jgi:hypothetical protein